MTPVAAPPFPEVRACPDCGLALLCDPALAAAVFACASELGLPPQDAAALYFWRWHEAGHVGGA